MNDERKPEQPPPIDPYATNDPVAAPSVNCRAKKFLRRHKGPVIAAALVFLTLIAGIIGTTIGMVQAEQARAGEAKQREMAEANETRAELAAEMERKANERAQKRLAQIRIANELIASTFEMNKFDDELFPLIMRKDNSNIRQHLAKRMAQVVDTIDMEAIDDGEAAAELQHVLGTIWFGLGEYDKVIEVLTKAHATREKLHGMYHPDTFSSMNALAVAYTQGAKVPGPDWPADWESHLNEMNAKQAEPFLEMALERTKSKFGPHHPDTLKSEHNLAWEYLFAENGRQRGFNGRQRAKGLLLLQNTLEKRKANLGLAHPDTLASWDLLALGYQMNVPLEKLSAFFEQAVEEMKAKLGPDHSVTLGTIKRLAGVLQARMLHFEKKKDAEGCRATAEKYEKLQRTDANGLYYASCMRAVTAAVIRATDKSAAGAKEADAEADRAITWLRQSVAAGFNNAAHMKKDTDLDALRQRPDFQKVLTELEAAKGKKKI